jgi:hypothetical protein
MKITLESLKKYEQTHNLPCSCHHGTNGYWRHCGKNGHEWKCPLCDKFLEPHPKII